jgi:prolyl-tRNA editing enzyme YbaK/EbsC (Cys-tRNA(Pro) deacylase)
MSERKDGPGRFVTAAKALGLEVALREFSESTRTAEEAAAACGCDVGQIVKSLVFQGKTSKKPYMLLVSGRNRVDQKGVAALIGEALDRPDGQYVRDLTGFAIGGIPPLGHDRPLKTYMDEDLLQYDRIWAAAGSPNSVFPTEPRHLATIARAEVIKVRGA